MSPGFDDTSRAHGDALARAFAESPPSVAGDPPARFSPGKHAVSNGDSHPVRVPKALEEAMRLQSLERFARRKETEARTMSPLRKAEVREARARSVCGTGVAERKTLGTASKLKIDAIVRAGAQRPETFGLRRLGETAKTRSCADSIQGVHHKSGRFEKPGSAMDFKCNDHDSVALLALVDQNRADAVAKAVGAPDASALSPPAPALRADKGWSEAGNENRPSMRAPREGHDEYEHEYEYKREEPPSSHVNAVPESFPSSEARALSLPSSRDAASREEAFEKNQPSSTRPAFRDPRDSAREPLRRQDTAFDAEQLRHVVAEKSEDEAVVSREKGKETEREEGTNEAARETEVPRDDVSPDAFTFSTPRGMRKNVDDVASGVLEALVAAGPAVRALSLEERKELFEVAVQEQVTALTHQLFPPEEGTNPRVHIDVAV
jgi:hypothetical protein